MLYREFGREGWEASILGLGCMRLPTGDGVPGSADIDEEKAVRLIRRAIDAGVNYLDTAYTYHEGRSEVLLGKALREGYRERARVASKSPVWLLEKADDFDRFLEAQLERLQAGPIDYYLLHGLNRRLWDKARQMGLLARAEAAMRDGRVGRIGFSFHDDHHALREIIEGYDGWSMCLIQYNYMDTHFQAGTRGLRYAAARGLGVAVMEPLLGGYLARPPADVREIFAAHPERRTPAQWALQWVWEHPEVAVVLSGMSNMEELEENILAAAGAAERPLGEGGLEVIARAREALESKAAVPCTRCAYCLPCPQGVDIPSMFDLYNSALTFDDLGACRARYRRFFAEGERAGACIGCGECEERCPQGIAIGEMMPVLHAVLGEGRPPPPAPAG